MDFFWENMLGFMNSSMVLALYKHHKQTQANNMAVVMFFNANMSYTIKPRQVRELLDRVS
jgi:hypothetical protein